MDKKTRNIGLLVGVILIFALVGYTVFLPSVDQTLNISNVSANQTDDQSSLVQDNAKKNTVTTQGKLCDACDGSGKDNCMLCNGTGKEGNQTCEGCNGVGQFPCDACGGDGYINKGDKGYEGHQ
jgi:hypothetical protein